MVFLGGVILHVLLLGSVFEIYFKTPIVPDIQSNKNPVPGPAKRLVFIVADGLRADSFYRNDIGSTQFLRCAILFNGQLLLRFIVGLRRGYVFVLLTLVGLFIHRAKIESHASWGVSHTRVPTESRPGVVALAAGIYEDPSAVFKVRFSCAVVAPYGPLVGFA